MVGGCYLGPIRIAPQPDSVSNPPAAPTPTQGSPATPRSTPDAGPSTEAGPGPTFIPGDPGVQTVYLAPIGSFPGRVTVDLADFVLARYDITVRILEPAAVETSAFDTVRDQYVAEELLGHLDRSYPRSTPDDGSVIIGLLADDLYIRDRPDWNWAFGIRGGNGHAVVSTARMGSLEEPIAPIVMSRLRKMVVRDIGVLFYGLPLNYDPISVLYADILSVDDLDRMSEEFCGSDCPSRASTGTLAALPD